MEKWFLFILCFVILGSTLAGARDVLEIFQKPTWVCDFEAVYNQSCGEVSLCYLSCRHPLKCTADDICTCKAGYFPDFEEGTCSKCPNHGFKCIDGCCARGLVCVEGTCMYNNEDLIRYTSSVALVTALLLGVTAMATMIWRVCRSTLFVSNRFNHRRNSTGSLGSINSIQQLVNDRLRDRPPTYRDVIAKQRAEARRLAANVEQPPAYTLFANEQSGQIFHISNKECDGIENETNPSNEGRGNVNTEITNTHPAVVPQEIDKTIIVNDLHPTVHF